MAQSLYSFEIGPISASYTAYGYSGATLMSFGSGTLPEYGSFQLKADPALNPVVQVSTSEGEIGRMRIKPGINKMVNIGVMPTGVIGDEYDVLKAEIDRVTARITGRFNYDSGSPASLIHLNADLAPAAPVSIEAIQIGATSSTIGYALIGTNGWVTLEGGGGPSSAYDVRISGEWTKN